MPDDIQAKIAKAKAAGYSDAEIQAYLSKAGPQTISGSHPPPSNMPTGSFQMHQGGPIETPADIKSLVTAHTGIGNTLPLGTEPLEARQLAVEAAKQYPKELSQRVSQEPYYDAALSPLALLAGYGTGNPVATAKGLAGSAVGAPIGAAVGRYAGGPKYGNVGAGLGGLVGSLYGGYRAMKGGPIPFAGASKLPGIMGRIGRALEAFSEEEPSIRPGAAPEAAGGTAATAGETAASATPAAGPKNASELSSVANRVKHGQPPSSPTIYTPESLASEQGMSTAALGKGGFNLTIPPEQQRIMQMVAQGKVPMGGGAKPGLAGLTGGNPGPFEGAYAQPPSGTSPSFGEPEGPLDAAIRGAAGQNPVIKSTDRAMAQETPNLFKMTDKLRKFKRRGL